MRTTVVGLLALCVGAALTLLWVRMSDWRVLDRSGGPVAAHPAEEVLVMRTRGGLLEVSHLRVTETFDRKFVYSVLGVPVGSTTPRIRVPAHYRYQIALAPEWSILRAGELFIVVAPAVKPSLPVAVDLARIEKEVSGSWILETFNGPRDLDELERGMTAALARKAASPAYIRLQREHARRTVHEFVERWLLTQVPWQFADRPRLQVLFADESVASIDTFGATEPARP